MSLRPPLSVPRRSLTVLAFGAVVAALAVPGAAGPAARIVLVATGVLFAAVGATSLLRSVPFASASRFEPSTTGRERREVPPELESLTSAVRASTDAAGRQVLDDTIRTHIQTIATRRLLALRLDPNDPADHQTIQRRLSLPLWAIVSAGPSAGTSGHLPSTEIPASSLAGLLDELEGL